MCCARRCSSFACSRQQAPEPPPSKVTVAHPIERELTDWDEYTARLEAVDSVEVRARVSGYLESVHFREGSLVKKGDLLFQIDPRPYEAQLHRAQGDLELAKSRVNLAQKNLARAAFLIKSQAMSKEEAETRAALVRQAEAGVAAAQAAVDAAKLDVEFTRITAPVSGRVSRKFVTEGNLINGGIGTQGTLLTTIVSLDPLYVYFEANERDYLKYVRLAKSGARPSSRDFKNPVWVGTADEQGFPHEGYMDFVDNQIDRGTGTIQGRGIVPNPDGLLAPGLFVRLRLIGSGKYRAAADPRRSDPERPGAEVRLGGRRPEPRPLPPDHDRDPARRPARGERGADAGRSRHHQRRAARAPGRRRRAGGEDHRGRRRTTARSRRDAGCRMNVSRFFIDRPIFAAVISIVTVIVGIIAYRSLPVAQYPDVVPPTIVVTATYPGAPPEVIADTVATPIEQEVNGVEDMLYMSSQSTTDGQMPLTITFKLGTDLDKAQVLVQNRVAIAEPRLPEDVRRLGVTTIKSSPDLLMVVHLLSPDGRYDQLYIGNYALIQMRDALARVDGVGQRHRCSGCASTACASGSIPNAWRTSTSPRATS